MSPSKSALSALAVPNEDLQIVQAIVLDWQDGPVDGFLKFATPLTAWRFQLLGERQEDDDVDSRLYLLSGIPDGKWEKLRESLGEDEGSPGPLWIPTWQFDSNEARDAADRAVSELEHAAGAPELIIKASGNLRVSEMWLVRNGAIGL